jgi:hypothetical protein
LAWYAICGPIGNALVSSADILDLRVKMNSSRTPTSGLSPNDWLALASFLGIVIIVVWHACK